MTPLYIFFLNAFYFVVPLPYTVKYHDELKRTEKKISNKYIQHVYITTTKMFDVFKEPMYKIEENILIGVLKE